MRTLNCSRMRPPGRSGHRQSNKVLGKQVRRWPRPAAAERCDAQELSLPDSIYARLHVQPIEKGTQASAITLERLDRNPIRHRTVTDGQAERRVSR